MSKRDLCFFIQVEEFFALGLRVSHLTCHGKLLVFNADMQKSSETSDSMAFIRRS